MKLLWCLQYSFVMVCLWFWLRLFITSPSSWHTVWNRRRETCWQIIKTCRLTSILQKGLLFQKRDLYKGIKAVKQTRKGCIFRLVGLATSQILQVLPTWVPGIIHAGTQQHHMAVLLESSLINLITDHISENDALHLSIALLRKVENAYHLEEAFSGLGAHSGQYISCCFVAYTCFIHKGRTNIQRSCVRYSMNASKIEQWSVVFNIHSEPRKVLHNKSRLLWATGSSTSLAERLLWVVIVHRHGCYWPILENYKLSYKRQQPYTASGIPFDSFRTYTIP